MLWPNAEFDYSSGPDGRQREAAIDNFYQSERSKRPVSDCIVESSSPSHPPAKRMRSAFHAKDLIDVDIDDSASYDSNQSGTSMRGGTHSLHKLLPSGEKLSQRLLGTCRLSQNKLRYVR